MEMTHLSRILLVALLEILGRASVTAELSSEAAVNDTKAMDLLRRVMKSANPLIRPNVYGKPVVVQCGFYVQSMGPINEVEMEYSMELYLRLRWLDERVSFSDKEPPLMVPTPEMHKLWVPDVYFPNEKEGKEHRITTPNRALTVFPNGTIIQSSRLTLRLECNMLLMSFPLDYQRCEIRISSYAFDSSQMDLLWFEKDPVLLGLREVSLQQFQLLNISWGACELTYKPGEFSCLVAAFHLKREIGFYVLQTYIPSILIVTLSWVSFWISKDAVPARISLGVTTVLTMTTQLSTSRSNSMRVSYPKAIDVWYASCMVFVFGALLEYALINVLSRGKGGGRRGVGFNNKGVGTKKNKNAERLNADSHLTTNDIEMQGTPKSDYCTLGQTTVGQDEEGVGNSRSAREIYTRVLKYFRSITPKGVDHASRLIFPGAFVVFNFIYWIVYTQPGLFVLSH